MLGAVGCGDSRSDESTDAASGPIRAVATTGMVADLVRGVGGDAVEVTTLIRSGVDPHLYKPVTADVRLLREADVIFVNGLGLEGKMGDVLASLQEKGTPVVEVAAAVPHEKLIAVSEAGHEGAVDPHVWMSPKLWAECALPVGEALSRLRPDEADALAKRAIGLSEDLWSLSSSVDAAVAKLPAASRRLVTAHDAFSYFGRDYGFEVDAIQGITTESEAGVADINALVDGVVENDVKAVFVESTVPDRTIKALIEGAAARGHEVRLGATLYSDAMGPEDTYEGTYLGMIDHNVTHIVAALGGEVPAGGMSGTLTVPAAGPNVVTAAEADAGP